MMSPTESAEVDHLRRMALPSFVGMDIGREFWGADWIPYPWVQYVEQRVLDAILDETHERYVIVNLPPQVGKSSYIGTLLPFWITGMKPDKACMYISYSGDFSEARSKDVRALHARWGQELFGVAIDPDRNKIGEWGILGHRGGMLSVGVGGLITGKPGDVIIIDDLIKNAEEARSDAAKKGHLAEWQGTIKSRLQPGGTVIIVATRWAEDDLSGALINEMNQPNYIGPQWEVISLPAFAEPNEELEGELTPEELEVWTDRLGRKFGEVLDCRFSRIPGRAPEDFFTFVKAGMSDPMTWASLYQQRPFSAEGSMFHRENWRYYKPDERPEMDQLVRVWDLAGTEGGGDWTVGTKMGVAQGKLWVIDVERFRHASGMVLNKVVAAAAVDGYGCKILVEEEKGGAGKSTVAAIQKLLPGYNVEAAKAEGDKRSRATLWSSEQQNNRAMLPEEGSVAWDVKGFKDEHVRMMQDGRLPKHDDRIDTAAYGALELVGARGVDIYVPELGESLSPDALMNHLLGQSIVAG